MDNPIRILSALLKGVPFALWILLGKGQPRVRLHVRRIGSHDVQRYLKLHQGVIDLIKDKDMALVINTPQQQQTP